eukprot:Sspe_Gene.29788::Locus_14354_Transcript_1_1_Confidence_1.000_Length_1427::g.29788::m.29788
MHSNRDRIREEPVSSLDTPLEGERADSRQATLQHAHSEKEKNMLHTSPTATTEIRVLPSGEIVVRQSPSTAAPTAPKDAAAPPSGAKQALPTTTASPSTSLVDLGIKMVVFDMAGTTVDEGGIVYDTLKAVMRDAGLEVDDKEFDAWHGANKREVVAHFVKLNNAGGEAEIDELYKEFEEELESIYFAPDSPVKPIPGILKYFTRLRKAGIKVCLDTGFPRKIASHIIKKLGFADYIDGSCVAMEVGHGRPYPYMIYHLMREHGIERIQQVAKVGDTVRDIEEGLYAGTPYTYGVLTGADKRETLEKAGAFAVVNSVLDIPITEGKRGGQDLANGREKRRKM